MDDTKRATIYFDADVHRALRLKSASTNRSMSEMVNEAVRMALAEDAVDLAAADQRASEPSGSFEAFVQDLRARGRL
jgi:plasmid stability protein